MKKEELIAGLIIMAAVALGIGCVYLKASYKAQAYERLTGKHVTIMDAMFLDLRIQEQVK